VENDEVYWVVEVTTQMIFQLLNIDPVLERFNSIFESISVLLLF
jgi:hypothetical protein